MQGAAVYRGYSIVSGVFKLYILTRTVSRELHFAAGSRKGALRLTSDAIQVDLGSIRHGCRYVILARSRSACSRAVSSCRCCYCVVCAACSPNPRCGHGCCVADGSQPITFRLSALVKIPAGHGAIATPNPTSPNSLRKKERQAHPQSPLTTTTTAATTTIRRESVFATHRSSPPLSP
jgi:hypothetical protein